jgi:N-acetylneuraminic acid mutarotase
MGGLMKGRFAVLTLMLLLCLSMVPLAPDAAAVDYGWVEEGPLPIGRTSFVSAMLPTGEIFVAFGVNVEINEPLDSAQIYDLETMTVTTLASAPTRLESPTGAYLNGRVYAFGGMNEIFNWQDTTLLYDFDTDAWSASQDLPYVGYFMRCAAVDDENILLVGGYNYSDTAIEACYLFNVNTEVFTPVASMPEGRSAGGLAFMDGTVYYFGGWDDSLIIRQEIFAYDVASDSWSLAGMMPKARAAMAAAAVSDGRVYLMGGGPNYYWIDEENVAEALAWNPASGDFDRLPDLPSPFRYGAAFQVGDRVLCFGGHDYDTSNPDILSLEVLQVSAELIEGAVEQGSSAWVRVRVDSDGGFQGSMRGTVQVVQGNTTWCSVPFYMAAGNEVVVELPMSEGMPFGAYHVIAICTSIDEVIVNIDTLAMSLSVMEAPSTEDRFQDLSDQNQDLQDQLDALQNEINDTRAELKDATDAKLDATIGYVILILVIAVLVVAVISLVRKR